MYAAILWLKGEISLLLDQLDAAAEYFQRVRSRFLDLEMAWELTLTLLRMAKVYFLQGERRCLQAALEEMLWGQENIERSDKVLGAALGEFLAESARDQINAELLEQMYRKMRGRAEVALPLLPLSLPVPKSS